MQKALVSGVALLMMATTTRASAEQRWIYQAVQANKQQTAVLADSERMTDIVFFTKPAPNASVAQAGQRFSTSDPNDMAWLRTLIASTTNAWVRVDWVDPATNQPAPNADAAKFWRWATIRFLRLTPGSSSSPATYELWAEGSDFSKPTTIKSNDVAKINGLIAASRR